LTDVGRMLWQGCHVLRHEGVAYDEYVDQLSLLLFVKMAAELQTSPSHSHWRDLISTKDDRLLDEYESLLKKLGADQGLMGDIFEGAHSRFRTANGLRSVLELLDNINWSTRRTQSVVATRS
jgi:type I restriction enzyme M protein